MLSAFSLQEEDEMEILLGKNVVIAVSNLLSLGPSEDTFITWEPEKKNPTTTKTVVWLVYKHEKFISHASGS